MQCLRYIGWVNIIEYHIVLKLLWTSFISKSRILILYLSNLNFKGILVLFYKIAHINFSQIYSIKRCIQGKWELRPRESLISLEFNLRILLDLMYCWKMLKTKACVLCWKVLQLSIQALKSLLDLRSQSQFVWSAIY